MERVTAQSALEANATVALSQCHTVRLSMPIPAVMTFSAVAHGNKVFTQEFTETIKSFKL